MYTYVSLRMQQRSVNGSHHKHFSLGGDLQNFAEGQDEDFVEEVIFPDLLEVKAADYKDDQEQIKKQQANIFVPSSSPGKGDFFHDIFFVIKVFKSLMNDSVG